MPLPHRWHVQRGSQPRDVALSPPSPSVLTLAPLSVAYLPPTSPWYLRCEGDQLLDVPAFVRLRRRDGRTTAVVVLLLLLVVVRRWGVAGAGVEHGGVPLQLVPHGLRPSR